MHSRLVEGYLLPIDGDVLGVRDFNNRERVGDITMIWKRGV